jgi:hypothetical protein
MLEITNRRLKSGGVGLSDQTETSKECKKTIIIKNS